MVVLGYLLKLKRALGLAWMHIFCMIFPKRCLFNTLSIDKVSIPYPFSFSKYQTKRVFKFLSRQWMTLETLRLSSIIF